jgi:hypothetical protein
MPRFALLPVLALLAVVLSGCVSIKRQSAVQRLPGFVTLRLDICASDRDRSTYANCDPGRNTAEDDNGLDGDSRAGRGQLLVGFRVPSGTGAPASFVSADGSATFTRNASYVAQLDGRFPPPAGLRWEGYSSTELPFDPTLPDDRETRIEPEFVLPPGADGAPFEGPFRWRAVVGFRPTGAGAAGASDPIVCDELPGGIECFDSPATGVTSSLSSGVSDLGVLVGRGGLVGQGETAVITFPLANRDGGGLGARTVALSASSAVPGATAAPTAGSVTVPANGSATAGVRVVVPPGTPLGTYAVTLSAATGDLRRSNVASITVVDRIAPAIRVNRPVDGARWFVGERVAADFACADQPNGSGVRACTGSVPLGAPLDTATPGTKTFRVTSEDRAGNTATATRTYRVDALRTPPAPPPERLNFTIGFDFSSASRSTRFTRLLVKEAPRGATVQVTCRGRSCPTRRVRGSRRPAAFTQRVGTRAITLRPWIRKPLRAGTVLKVTLTRPGAVGRVKTLTVRTNRRPLTRTTCLRPNSKTARTPCA